jgi:serine/threonine protein phosphatase PrpC
MSPQTQFSVSSFSHIGNRKENQDRLSVSYRPDNQGLLCIVADGMGGHEGGALAAQTITDTASSLWQQHCEESGIDTSSAEKFLHELISAMHNAVIAAGNTKGLEPRSTVAVFYLYKESEEFKALSIHAGDSRITQYSADTRVAKSFDHSLAQLKVLRGKITEAEMADDPDQSKVISNIGGEDLPDPEITHWDISKGKKFTVCSDGFWEVFSDQEVLDLFDLADDKREQAIEAALVAKMQTRPKHDNTTVIMIEIDKT